MTQEDIDIALDTVIQTAEKASDMLFTHKIMKSMYVVIKYLNDNSISDLINNPHSI